MLGIIGGTGFYQMTGLTDVEPVVVATPYGPSSAAVRVGKLGDQKVAFLPRHGDNHSILPSEINFRANIWALKAVGVRRIISISATGSLVQDIKPGDLGLVSQYFDFTKGKREASFFGKGLVGHISTAEAACPDISTQVEAACRAKNVTVHSGRTYACVEGPRLGTKAESWFLKNAGCHLVGMTNVPESFLAREAQLCYCTLAVATDYDCWLDDPSEHATVDKIMALYAETLNKVKDVIRVVLENHKDHEQCSCRKALEGAIITPEEKMTEEQKRIVGFLRG